MVWRMEDGSFVISGLTGGLIANAEGYIKEWTQAGGERDTELLRTMGGYEYHDPKNTNMMEFTATCIGSNALFRTMLLGGSQAITTGSAVEKWPRLQYNIFGIFTDTTASTAAQMKLSCFSAYVTNVGLRGSSTDSLEETVTWKCLPKDFRHQYTSNRSTTPIV